jgi:hypothetical protein
LITQLFRKTSRKLILTAILSGMLALTACSGGTEASNTSDNTVAEKATVTANQASESKTAADKAAADKAAADKAAADKAAADKAAAEAAAAAAEAAAAAAEAAIKKVYQKNGIVLKSDPLPGLVETDIQEYGWEKDVADNNQGLLTFDYNGVSFTMYWSPWKESPGALLNDSYALLTASRTDKQFTAINDGPLTVDDNEGKFAVFSAKDDSNVLSGGLIGVWSCGDDRGFTLIASGADATSAQLRFDRLLGAFQCK